MKKNIFIVLLSTIALYISAQDTVHYGDSWYRFKPASPLSDDSMAYRLAEYHGGSDALAGHPLLRYYEIVQMYPVEYDSVRIYGVAVTVTDVSGQGLKPEKVVLFRKIEGGDPPVVEVVDSATCVGNIRQCYYEYEFSLPQPSRRTVTCYEYYFDQPCSRENPIIMTDTFYIGTYLPVSLVTHYNGGDYKTLTYEYGIMATEGQSDIGCDENRPRGNWWFGWTEHSFLAGNPYTGNYNCTASQEASSAMWGRLFDCGGYNQCADYNREGWGMMFPIVGLRCKAPNIKLVEKGFRSATLSWSQSEAGALYQLSYAPYGAEPDSGMMVTTTDTFYTVTGLEAGARKAVWVRKACQYTSWGCDTMVWSDWSQPLAFIPLGIGEVDDGDVRVYVRGNNVAVEGTTGEEVRLYDMMGRCLATRRQTDNSTLLLPVQAKGVYMVQVGFGPVHRVVVR